MVATYVSGHLSYLDTSLHPKCLHPITSLVFHPTQQISNKILEKKKWEKFKEKVLGIGITIDASWFSLGWSATDAGVLISVDTGKVLDVVHMSSLSAECKRIDE